LKIGLSLSIGYLAGRPASKADKCWLSILGPASQGLSWLKSMGIGWIELHTVYAQTPSYEITKSVEAVFQAELRLTAHIWLPTFAETNCLPDNILLLDRILRAGNMEYREVPVVVHGHKPSGFPSLQEAERQTVADIQNLFRCLRKLDSPLVPVFELCRRKDDAPIGNTYQETCKILDLIHPTEPGICWDMGHSWANYLHDKQEIMPPEEFLDRVAHTHIHDIGPGDRTHGPLGYTGITIEDYVTALVCTGYEGVYNLELSPTRWTGFTTGQSRKSVEKSIIVLQEVVSRTAI